MQFAVVQLHRAVLIHLAWIVAQVATSVLVQSVFAKPRELTESFLKA